jgi:hypothetical protein
VEIDQLSHTCLACQERISALETVSVSQEARLVVLEKKLNILTAGNHRIEALVQRLLNATYTRQVTQRDPK